MQQLRHGARRRLANDLAAAICTLDFGPAAVAGLEEDLFNSRLSMSDLEELVAITVDHARGTRPQAPHPEEKPMPMTMLQTPPSPWRRAPRKLWKYNVDPDHLDICVRNSVFAEDVERNLVPGDLLLLQQLKQRVRIQHERITHILEFERREPDRTGMSTRLWGKPYRYIIYGRMVQLQQPFSLEDLGLSKSYSQPGKMSPERVVDVDEPRVLAAIGPWT
jgi:hypothetical protein